MKYTLLLALLAPAGAALAAASAGPAPAAGPVQPVIAVAHLQATAGTRLVVAPTGNEVRYRIREHLVGMELPYDAVGTASEVTGAVVIGADGKLVPAQSRVVVNVAGLKSDKDRRDGYVQRRLLETEKFPTVELAPTALRGLSEALPISGTRTFELLGNLTVRGITRPTTWRVTARFQGDRVTGTAATRFTFADFEMTQPRVPVILSLADTIALEYDFNLRREGAATR
jgi:polyisoprenoid-binding protein YceI